MLAKEHYISLLFAFNKLLSLFLKVRSKKEIFPKHETGNRITRLEIMQFAAASLCVIALLLAEPSDARVRKPEVRRKIMKKHELERKKSGVSKNNPAEKQKSRAKETDPSRPIFPDLPTTLAESFLEVTLPGGGESSTTSALLTVSYLPSLQ